MLVTEIYNGQGLGNQLACYVTTRVVALDKGLDFGILNWHKFKCLDFMDLDFGLEVYGGSIPYEGAPPTTLPNGIHHYFREKDVRHPNGSDIRIDDPDLELVLDNTKLDGVFQSEDRIIHRKEEIKKWLKVKPEKDCYDYSNENICVINFRGGEYSSVPNFFLSRKYWSDAIERMLLINPNFEFIVITDDVYTAKNFFPNFKVFHFDIATDYTIIKNAHYLILSNSSFPYFATFTSETIKYIIAPKYWGRYNISDGYWSCGYNIYRNHNYIDKDNKIFSFEDCKKEFIKYYEQNKHLWIT
jgi:hypothetical protein